MKKTVKIMSYVVMLFALMITSCSKDGAEGPQGPQGDQGSEGPAGPIGDTGTANVIYSDWITVQESEWSPNSGIVSRKTAILNAPEINQKHMDTSAILVYVKKTFGTSPNSIALLPMDDNEFEFIVDGIDIGEIVLKARRIDLGTFSNSFVPLPFRYIIIPGGLPAKDQAQPEFKKLTYEEVMDYFEIPY